MMLRKMGEQSNVNHVHPHKFRRTMATAAIDKGMPIGQVQRLLGHEKIDTKAEASAISASEMEFFGSIRDLKNYLNPLDVYEWH